MGGLPRAVLHGPAPAPMDTRNDPGLHGPHRHRGTTPQQRPPEPRRPARIERLRRPTRHRTPDAVRAPGRIATDDPEAAVAEIVRATADLNPDGWALSTTYNHINLSNPA